MAEIQNGICQLESAVFIGNGLSMFSFCLWKVYLIDIIVIYSLMTICVSYIAAKYKLTPPTITFTRSVFNLIINLVCCAVVRTNPLGSIKNWRQFLHIYANLPNYINPFNWDIWNSNSTFRFLYFSISCERIFYFNKYYYDIQKVSTNDV